MWTRFHHETMNNLKTKALAARLGLPVYSACGLLALLWSWSIENASGEIGDISRYTCKTIEAACGWDGKRGVLIAALKECGFVEGEIDDDEDPLRIHDWSEYNGAILKERACAAERKRRERERKKQGASVTVTRDSHPANSHSHSNNQHIQNTEHSGSSTTSRMSEDDRDLYAYFKSIFPQMGQPSMSYFSELLGKGFEPLAIRKMIEMTRDASASNPVAYFKKICEDKEQHGLFSEKAIIADEASFEKQKKPFDSVEYLSKRKGGTPF